MRRSVLTVIGIGAVIVMALAAVFLSGNTGQKNPQANDASNATGNNSQQSGPKVQSEIKVYYISLGNVAGSPNLIGCNDGLVEKTILIDGLKNDIHEAYKQEFALGNPSEPGLYNALSRSTLQVTEIRIENRTAYVDVNGQLISSDNCDRARIRAQLEWPAYQFEDVDRAVVRVNGYLLEELFQGSL